MSEALIVNPYDEHEMVNALIKALRMPVHEQQERMRLTRQQVRTNAYRWAGHMLLGAAQIRQRQCILDLVLSDSS
jgi:trehalose-6-phosphate synthase